MSSKNETNTMGLTTKIAITAILLAICIASQFLKNLSVYITGPIVNLCLVLAVMTAGLWWGLALAVITPVTAFLIAASPVMQMVPGIIPLIAAGNAVLVVLGYFLFRPAVLQKKVIISIPSVIMAIVCSLAKAVFMGLTIALWLLPTFIPQESKLYNNMPVFQMTFSVTQGVTALIGFVYFFIVWVPLRKSFLQGE
jgi:hypothetical protein